MIIMYYCAIFLFMFFIFTVSYSFWKYRGRDKEKSWGIVVIILSTITILTIISLLAEVKERKTNVNRVKERIEKIQKIEADLSDFNFVRDQIEKFDYITYERYKISDKWLNEQLHLHRVRDAITYVVELEKLPNLYTYEWLIGLIDTGVTYEEIQRDPNQVKALGYNALVSYTIKLLLTNTAERENIIKRALEEGVKCKELQQGLSTKINAPCVDLEREEDK